MTKQIGVLCLSLLIIELLWPLCPLFIITDLFPVNCLVWAQPQNKKQVCFPLDDGTIFNSFGLIFEFLIGNFLLVAGVC